MIAKVADKRKDGKSSFKDLVNYIAAHNEEKILFTEIRGFDVSPRGEREVIEEMESLASMNKRVSDAVFHGVLSFREGEIPTREQIDQAVDIYLKEMGLESCQCYFGVHQNTKNIHVHLCVNRIDPVTHLAVDPAGGPWKKANELASRKIELAQGWTIENSGVHYGVMDGEIYERGGGKGAVLKASLSGKARDYENYTAEKSAERIAKDDLAPILFDKKVKTWDELHRKLAEKGAEFKRSGSGAVLVIGDICVKVSSVSQRLSLKKLEKRLGAFEGKNEGIEVASCEPQPLRETTGIREYMKAKSEFYEKKRDIDDEFRNYKKETRRELRERQKEERKEMYGPCGTWKGKGAQLNAVRAELALRQALEKQRLEEHIAEMEKRRPRLCFPSYRDWETERGRKKVAELWRYRETIEGVVTGDRYVAPRQSRGLLRYGTSWDGKTGALSFVLENSVAFVDRGKRIDVFEWRNEKVILDVLMMAQEKWGRVTVHGSQQYKEACVEVAIKNNIQIRNPELQELIKMRQSDLLREKEMWFERKKNDLDPAVRRRREYFLEYCDAIGAERYRITAFWEVDKDGERERRGAVLGKRQGEVSKGMSVEEIIENWDLIERWNREHKNIYVTPLSEKMHHILVDDMSKETMEQFLRDGYKPAVILESSPQNFQAILNVPNIGKKYGLGKEVSNELMRNLNQIYGDKKIQGAIHPHRVPGFNNFKEERRYEDGSYPEVIWIEHKGGVCDKAFEDSKKIFDVCRKSKLELERQKPIVTNAALIGGALTPYEAYMIHAKDVVQNALHGSVENWNRIDSMIAVRMAVTGYSSGEIKTAVEYGGPDIRPEKDRNKHVWPDYARRTAEYIESVAGQRAVNRYLGCKYKWLQLEGRAPGKERDVLGI